MKNKWRRPSIIFLCIFVLCFAALRGAWQMWFDPYRGTVDAFSPSEKLETVLSTRQTMEDLDYIVNRLAERHPACIKGLPNKVKVEYEREREKIASLQGVPILSLWQSAARILGSLGDAHTSVGVKYKNGPALPFTFVWDDDVLTFSGGEYKGFAVIEIGDVLIENLYKRFLSQFSYELESWGQHSFAARLNRSEYLSFVGVNTQGGVSLLLENPSDGNRITVVYELQEKVIDDTGEVIPHFDYSLNQSTGIGIFTLRQCTYDDEYRIALHEFFIEVKEQNLHNIVIDLRGNPGGNSLVANEFLRYLPIKSYRAGSSEIRKGPIIWKNRQKKRKNHQNSPVFMGDVYVLTSKDTFSSAVDFATLISDNNLGTVVGEIPGNMPSSYGDILYFQTPNARLAFTVSYKYFVRPDEKKSNSPLLPNVLVIAESALEEVMQMVSP